MDETKANGIKKEKGVKKANRAGEVNREGGQGEVDMGIWNINTLTGKEVEIVEEMKQNKLQILGLSETKKKGKGKMQLDNGYMLYYTGVQQDQRAKEGVGIIINDEMDKRVIQFKAVNSRVMVVSIEFSREEVVNIIQIYGPVEGAIEEEMNEFYETLQRVLDEVREENEATVIMGDWNSRVGRDRNRGMGCMGTYGEETINRNGAKMIEFCRRNDLIIGNTMWYQKLEDKYSFVAEERNAKSLIDYIVYTQNMSRTVRRVETRREAEVGTNHRLVVAKLGIEMDNRDETPEYTSLAIHRLNDRENRDMYRRVTDEEFKRREEEEKEWTLEERWKTFRETVLTTAENICGKRKFSKYRKRTKWWNEEIRRMVKEKKVAWHKYNRTGTQADRQEYNERRKLVKVAIRQQKRKTWREFGEQITETHRLDNRKFWTCIKRLRGGKRKEIKAVRDKSNKLQTGTREILETWREYYTDKFNTPANEEGTEAVEREQQGITRAEVEEAIQGIKLRRASGEDGIAPEMIKWLGERGREWVWKTINEAWKERKIPAQWENNVIIPIYKKGEQTECENYRAICLAQTTYKLYTRILERRLRESVERKLGEEQAAFRPGRQTSDNIFILRNIIERKMGEGGELFLTFIDLKAAFDTVDRGEIWKTLQELEVSKELIEVIRSVYETVRARIQIAGQRSEEFRMNRGIKQGDSLSPLLFVVLMDKIVRRTKDKGNHLNMVVGYRDLIPIKMMSLLYADDVVLMANSRDKMQKLVDIWTGEIENMKMEVNTNKTKVMIINEKQGSQNIGGIKCKGEILERVTTYEYLGSVITDDGKIDAEITNKANKSTRLYYSLNKTILGHKNIDMEVKMMIHGVITVPIITYASENWTVRKKDETRINAIEMKHLRRIAGKTKWDRVKNEEIRQITGQIPMVEKIRRKQLNWYGHIIRMSPDRLTRTIMEAGHQGRRRRGRPRRKWIDQIKEEGARKGVTLGEMRRIAKDREEWKRWIREEAEPEPTTDT